MTITYPISLPTPVPSKSKLTQKVAGASAASPFDLSQQVYNYTGEQWLVDFTLPPMKRIKAEAWIAALMSLRGQFGTFLAGDYDAIKPMGTALGTPLVNGNGQTGNVLSTKGWSATKTGLLLPGDYIQLGSGATARLYKLMEICSSNGSGVASFTIWPSLRSSPSDGDTITLLNTMTRWRLNMSAQSWDTNEASLYGISFSAIEALP